MWLQNINNKEKTKQILVVVHVVNDTTLIDVVHFLLTHRLQLLQYSDRTFQTLKDITSHYSL